MRWSMYGWVPLVFVAFEAGCTFYTACPADNGPGPSPSAGTGNNTGGSMTEGGSMSEGGGADDGGTSTSGGTGGTSGNGGAPVPLEGEWVNVTSNLAGLDSECGNLSLGAAKPDEDLLIVGIAQNGLWGSRDGGDQWERLGSDSDPEPITNRGSSLLFDPADSNTFWQTGIYNGTGLFKTTDGGKSFLPQNTHHNDFVTVDFTDPLRQTLLVSGHEQIHELFISTDGAKTWSPIGDNLPEEAGVCAFPYIVDAQTFLLGCGTYAGGQQGIFRSTDAGKSWTKVSDLGGGSAPLRASDGTLYWGSEGTGGLTASTDDGKTWSKAIGADLVFVGLHSNPLELPDGRIAAMSRQSVIVTDDGGKSWKGASPEVPYDPSGFFYSVAQRAFFIYRSTCGAGDDAVPEDGVMRFDFDYQKD